MTDRSPTDPASHATNTDRAIVFGDAEQCSLDADRLATRLDWIRREILPASRLTVRTATGFELHLADDAAVEEKVEHLISLERECCPGVGLDLSRRGVASELVLTVEGLGPDLDGALLRTRGRVQAARPDDRRFPWKRGGLTLGFGGLSGLFFCCLLPTGLGMLLGGLAAPLHGLDRPLPIALTSIAGGVVAWRFFGRSRGFGNPAHTSSGARAGCDQGC